MPFVEELIFLIALILTHNTCTVLLIQGTGTVQCNQTWKFGKYRYWPDSDLLMMYDPTAFTYCSLSPLLLINILGVGDKHFLPLDLLSKQKEQGQSVYTYLADYLLHQFASPTIQHLQQTWRKLKPKHFSLRGACSESWVSKAFRDKVLNDPRWM